MNATRATDKGIGVALLLGILAAGAAGAQYLGQGTELAAWGFAAAMTLATMAVAAVHLYG